jgi:hypothetical protein
LIFKRILYIASFTVLFLPVLYSKPLVKEIFTTIGRFDSTNHGFEEFISTSTEYNLFASFGSHPNFNIQSGISYWINKQIILDKDYSLSSIMVPIRFTYKFNPFEKWTPYFGAGIGLHTLIETYIKTEEYSTISYLIFSGFNYNFTTSYFINSEITYSYGNFSGIDNLNVEGLSFRLGLGQQF